MPRPYVTGYQGFFNPGLSASIAQGEQESSVIDTGGFSLVGIILPSVFTSTAITFEVGDSEDGYQATGEAVFSGVTTNGDTITINGKTLTFVDATPGASEVLIGATAAETAENLYDYLIASLDTGLVACTYLLQDTVITVTAKVFGTDGNAYTFAKSSSDITLTPSGGSLAGGGFRPLYTAANSQLSMTVSQGRSYILDPDNFQGFQFFKIKSGSTELAARDIICSLKGF